jgi:acyl-ACP thioesterase
MVERKVDFKHYNEFLYSDEKNIYIRKSDIDNNNHVNNVKYLEWMLDSTDDNILNNHNIKSISIEYKKEVIYSDKPKVHSFYKEVNGEIISKYKITTENIDHAYGQIIWREIDD